MLNTRVLLARRPAPALDAGCLALDRQPVSGPRAGQVLVRNLYLSCDPYLRLEMDRNLPLGAPVTARAVGQITQSADPAWQAGCLVWGFFAWEEFSLVPVQALHLVDPADGPLSHAIGVRGMPGLTAWAGMIDIGRPRPGDTVLVSAATGAVGSIAGQLAGLAGARTVAVTGGQRKAGHALTSLGYDAAVDYTLPGPLPAAIAAACPDGIDVYFDNVAGEVLAAALTCLRPHSRLVMCGAISRYDGQAGPPPDLSSLAGSGACATWFSVHDYLHLLPATAKRLGQLAGNGTLAYFEDITDGIASLPDAFLGLFRGANLGKRLVRLGQPD